MPKPVHLNNGKTWRSRKEAIEHFRKMLARYADGDMISAPADECDLRALLTRYDSVLPAGSTTKTGSGVNHFSRERNSGDRWATSGFHVHRTDGTSIDFSFYSAVQTEPPA
jgi:hypothetical protein